MPTLADVRNEINKALTSAEVPAPLYAVAGVGDLAAEKLRDAHGRFRELQLDRRLAGLPDEARALPARARTLRSDVTGRVLRFPGELVGSVVGRASDASGRATDTYDDLTSRGRKLVDRISHQQATRDLVDGAQEVVRSAKATATSVRHGAETARTSAKRTATTVRRTADEAAAAGTAAADKTGDGRSAPQPDGSAAPARKRTQKATPKPATTTRTAAAKKTTAKKAPAKKTATRKPTN